MRSGASASLFIYFRLASAQAAQARPLLLAMQASLKARHPGLMVRLLARTDEQHCAEQTWMETYEHPQGLSPTFQADLRAAVQALPPGLIGARHAESFSEFHTPADSTA